MVATSVITVGTRNVAELVVDPAQVRGEGGRLSPALVLAAQLHLAPQVTDEPLAVVRLEAALTLQAPPQAGRMLGAPAVAVGVGGHAGLWQQLPSATAKRPVELRFPLTAEHLRVLEQAATRVGRDDLLLGLRCTATVAAVAETRPVAAIAQTGPTVAALGNASLLRFCWETRVADAALNVGRDRWAEEVLPALGLDRVRLVAVRLPGPDTVPTSSIFQRFDRARVDFDAGRFREAIGHCRDLRNGIEQQLGATRADPVAVKVAARVGWERGDPRCRYLDGSWQALAVLTNDARHADGDRLTASDARATLLHTAVMVEYLGELLDSGLL